MSVGLRSIEEVFVERFHKKIAVSSQPSAFSLTSGAASNTDD
jgi:hypothetical protein